MHRLESWINKKINRRFRNKIIYFNTVLSQLEILYYEFRNMYEYRNHIKISFKRDIGRAFVYILSIIYFTIVDTCISIKSNTILLWSNIKDYFSKLNEYASEPEEAVFELVEARFNSNWFHSLFTSFLLLFIPKFTRTKRLIGIIKYAIKALIFILINIPYSNIYVYIKKQPNIFIKYIFKKIINFLKDLYLLIIFIVNVNINVKIKDWNSFIFFIQIFVLLLMREYFINIKYYLFFMKLIKIIKYVICVILNYIYIDLCYIYIYININILPFLIKFNAVNYYRFLTKFIINFEKNYLVNTYINIYIYNVSIYINIPILYLKYFKYYYRYLCTLLLHIYKYICYFYSRNTKRINKYIYILINLINDHYINFYLFLIPEKKQMKEKYFIDFDSEIIFEKLNYYFNKIYYFISIFINLLIVIFNLFKYLIFFFKNLKNYINYIKYNLILEFKNLKIETLIWFSLKIIFFKKDLKNLLFLIKCEIILSINNFILKKKNQLDEYYKVHLEYYVKKYLPILLKYLNKIYNFFFKKVFFLKKSYGELKSLHFYLSKFYYWYKYLYSRWIHYRIYHHKKYPKYGLKSKNYLKKKEDNYFNNKERVKQKKRDQDSIEILNDTYIYFPKKKIKRKFKIKKEKDSVYNLLVLRYYIKMFINVCLFLIFDKRRLYLLTSKEVFRKYKPLKWVFIKTKKQIHWYSFSYKGVFFDTKFFFSKTPNLKNFFKKLLNYIIISFKDFCKDYFFNKKTMLISLFFKKLPEIYKPLIYIDTHISDFLNSFISHNLLEKNHDFCLRLVYGSYYFYKTKFLNSNFLFFIEVHGLMIWTYIVFLYNTRMIHIYYPRWNKRFNLYIGPIIELYYNLYINWGFSIFYLIYRHFIRIPIYILRTPIYINRIKIFLSNFENILKFFKIRKISRKIRWIKSKTRKIAFYYYFEFQKKYAMDFGYYYIIFSALLLLFLIVQFLIFSEFEISYFKFYYWNLLYPILEIVYVPYDAIKIIYIYLFKEDTALASVWFLAISYVWFFCWWFFDVLAKYFIALFFLPMIFQYTKVDIAQTYVGLGGSKPWFYVKTLAADLNIMSFLDYKLWHIVPFMNGVILLTLTLAACFSGAFRSIWKKQYNMRVYYVILPIIIIPIEFFKLKLVEIVSTYVLYLYIKYGIHLIMYKILIWIANTKIIKLLGYFYWHHLVFLKHYETLEVVVRRYHADYSVLRWLSIPSVELISLLIDGFVLLLCGIGCLFYSKQFIKADEEYVAFPVVLIEFCVCLAIGLCVYDTLNLWLEWYTLNGKFYWYTTQWLIYWFFYLEMRCYKFPKKKMAWYFKYIGEAMAFALPLFWTASLAIYVDQRNYLLFTRPIRDIKKTFKWDNKVMKPFKRYRLYESYKYMELTLRLQGALHRYPSRKENMVREFTSLTYRGWLEDWRDNKKTISYFNWKLNWWLKPYVYLCRKAHNLRVFQWFYFEMEYAMRRFTYKLVHYNLVYAFSFWIDHHWANKYLFVYDNEENHVEHKWWYLLWKKRSYKKFAGKWCLKARTDSAIWDELRQLKLFRELIWLHEAGEEPEMPTLPLKFLKMYKWKGIKMFFDKRLDLTYEENYRPKWRPY